MLLTTPRHQK